MKSEARKIAEQNNYNAPLIAEILGGRPGVSIDNDWDNETTTFTFEDDGSYIVFSGPSMEVHDKPAE